jgi:hypothetical protein
MKPHRFDVSIQSWRASEKALQQVPPRELTRSICRTRLHSAISRLPSRMASLNSVSSPSFTGWSLFNPLPTLRRIVSVFAVSFPSNGVCACVKRWSILIRFPKRIRLPCADCGVLRTCSHHWRSTLASSWHADCVGIVPLPRLTLCKDQLPEDHATTRKSSTAAYFR